MKKHFLRYLIALAFIFNVAFGATNLVFAFNNQNKGNSNEIAISKGVNPNNGGKNNDGSNNNGGQNNGGGQTGSGTSASTNTGAGSSVDLVTTEISDELDRVPMGSIITTEGTSKSEEPTTVIKDDNIPKASLPQTGGMPFTDLFAIGSGLAALGFFVRRK